MSHYSIELGNVLVFINLGSDFHRIIFDQTPGLARVHHAFVRHWRRGRPALQVQLVLVGPVPAVDGRGASAVSAQQTESGKKFISSDAKMPNICELSWKIVSMVNIFFRSPTSVRAATGLSTTARSATAAQIVRRIRAATR